MATIHQERIPLSANHAATHGEIAQVMKLITANRTLSTRAIAAQVGTSSTRAHHIIQYLKTMGFIARVDGRRAWRVLVAYVEQER
jgi:DNA-binding IclR family transcriptional regulator